MKILLLTPTYPPYAGSHVQRMIKMVNSLIANGIDLYVLTYEINENHPTYDSSMNGYINGKASVIRVPMGYMHRRAYSTFKKESMNHYNKGEASKSLIKSKIYNYINKIKTRIFFPDSMVDWMRPVLKYVKKNKLISKISPDLILSCSEPRSVHLIGYRLSKKYGIPQYMDYADPWTYIGDYAKVQSTRLFKKNLKLETKIINHAIGISFSAPGCRAMYIDKFGLDLAKTEVAMSGLENSLAEYARLNAKRTVSEKLVMTYGGALHSYVRSPKPFFEAAKQLEEFLNITIRTDNVTLANQILEDSGGAKCINVKGYIRFAEYFDEMLSADVIVFFGNNNDIQVPGKIFNCIATGKHILYLKSNGAEKDSVIQILEQYGNYSVAENNKESICKVINDILVSKQLNIKGFDSLNSESLEALTDRAQFGKLSKHIQTSIDNADN